MTSRVEAEGNDIDEAIGNALAELGLAREEVRVEILQDAKRGLFGIGGQKARVAVSPRLRTGLAEPAAAEPPPAREPGPGPTKIAGGGEDTSVREALSGRASEAADVLGGILQRMDLEARVEAGPAAQPDGQTTLTIVTEHSALAIGRHGQTLDALEYLVNRVVGKNEERAARIAIDCEGYRERHRRELEDTARRLAEKVRSRGRAHTMTPMTPRDRRIVHLALAERSDVITRSVGQGYLRRIVIGPARGNRAANRS